MSDLNVIKYEYTLPDTLKLKEWIDMMTAIETAQSVDEETESNKTKTR